MTDTYDDGPIVCGPDRLEIHSYYFPVGTKCVSYTQIKGLQRIEINSVMSGKWRFWGTGNPRYWANLDSIGQVQCARVAKRGAHAWQVAGT